MKTTEKQQLAFSICDKYLEQHSKEITISELREAMGGGSPNDITKYKQLWQAKRAAADTAPLVAIPEALDKKINEFSLELWTVAIQQSEKRFEALREAIELEKEKAAAQIAEVTELANKIEAEASEAKIEINNLKLLLAEANEAMKQADSHTKNAEAVASAQSHQIEELKIREAEARKAEKAAITEAAELRGELKALKEIEAKKRKTQTDQKS